MRFAECWTWKLNWPLSYLTETTPGLDIFLKKLDFNLWNNRHISKVVPLQFLHTKRNLHRLIYVNLERTANEWRTANHSHLDSRKVGNKFRRENVKATECFFLDPTQRLVSGRGQFWVNDETTGCAAAAAAGADLFFFLFGCIWKVPELKSNGKIKMEENCVDHREQRPPNWREAPKFFLFCEQVSPIAVGRFHPLLPSTLWLLFHHPLFDSASAFSFF